MEFDQLILTLCDIVGSMNRTAKLGSKHIRFDKIQSFKPQKFFLFQNQLNFIDFRLKITGTGFLRRSTLDSRFFALTALILTFWVIWNQIHRKYREIIIENVFYLILTQFQSNRLGFESNLAGVRISWSNSKTVELRNWCQDFCFCRFYGPQFLIQVTIFIPEHINTMSRLCVKGVGSIHPTAVVMWVGTLPLVKFHNEPYSCNINL